MVGLTITARVVLTSWPGVSGSTLMRSRLPQMPASSAWTSASGCVRRPRSRPGAPRASGRSTLDLLRRSRGGRGRQGVEAVAPPPVSRAVSPAANECPSLTSSAGGAGGSGQHQDGGLPAGHGDGVAQRVHRRPRGPRGDERGIDDHVAGVRGDRRRRRRREHRDELRGGAGTDPTTRPSARPIRSSRARTRPPATTAAVVVFSPPARGPAHSRGGGDVCATPTSSVAAVTLRTVRVCGLPAGSRTTRCPGTSRGPPRAARSAWGRSAAALTASARPGT